MQIQISVIVPNYNGKHLLEKNLPGVFGAVKKYAKKENAHCEVIVGDDASSDDSASFLQVLSEKYADKLTSVSFYINEKNLGFSSNVNTGVEKASGEYVVLLNSDVSPKIDFLFFLMEHFKNKDTFGVGCLDESIENGEVVLRGRGIGDWRRGFLIHSAGRLDKRTTLWVSGGSSAFRKSIWNTLGGFTPLYNPYYWEDIDLSYRAQKSGFKVFFERRSVVEHRHEEGAIKKTQSKRKVTTTAFRNQFIFVWKNVTDIDILLAHIIWLPYHIVKALLRSDYEFLQGFLQAILRFPAILHARSIESKTFRLSDKEVVRMVES